MTPHQINLYDPSLRLQREWLGVDTALAAFAAALLIVACASAWVRWDLGRVQPQAQQAAARVQAQQAALVEATRASANARPSTALQAQLQIAQASLRQRQRALELLHSGAAGQPQGHAAALAALARQSADGLWITGLALDAQQVALRGRALNPELIPAYLARLNREPALAGLAFRALQIDRPAQPAADTASAASAAGTRAPKAAFVDFTLVSAPGADAPLTAPGAAR